MKSLQASMKETYVSAQLQFLIFMVSITINESLSMHRWTQATPSTRLLCASCPRERRSNWSTNT